jgi:hypothetical protein
MLDFMKFIYECTTKKVSGLSGHFHPSCTRGAFNLALHCRHAALQQRRRPFMILDLMSLLVDEAALFQTSGARDLAPWSGLSWCLFVPLVFVIDIAVAILAWLSVEWLAKLM